MSGSENSFEEIPVSAKLSLGSERLRLLFTENRIIVAHVGKRGAGAVAATNLLGRISSSLEDLFKSGRESLAKKGTRSLTPNQILRLDRDNFAIDYEEVVTVNVNKTKYLNTITILTGRDKLEFTTTLAFEAATRVLRHHLGERVVAGGMR